MNRKLHIKKGDLVQVNAGEDKGKQGKVLEVFPDKERAIVEGINMITKHMKPNRMGQSGSLIRAESPIYASKVQLVCPKCGKPTRVGHGFEVKTNAAGEEKKTPVRICKKCGHNF